jgi:hypothetical protein
MDVKNDFSLFAHAAKQLTDNEHDKREMLRDRCSGPAIVR